MKFFYKYFLIISIASYLITSCKNNAATAGSASSAAPFDLSSLQKTINDKNNDFAKAFINGDNTAMVNHYTKDAKLFPPNANVVIGCDAIRLHVSNYLAYGIKEFHDETTALYGSEDNLIEEGNFVMGDGKGNVIEKAKYISVWRKIDGEWKVYSNMWNSSIPVSVKK
ncbi:MAG TPA: hypothetical protein VK498_04050 [Ferruginibacter sp.]|nr:hypothetical protein [Ferruginibacter sp.]